MDSVGQSGCISVRSSNLLEITAPAPLTLVLPDLTERDGTGLVAVGLLDAAGGRGRLAGG